MCHAAVQLIDRAPTTTPPHGALFKAWGRIATRVYPDMDFGTCHSYEIQYKFTYICQNCGKAYGRQSKSINLDTQRCGVRDCHGRLALQPRVRVDGTPAKQGPNPFAAFVKEHFAATKSMLPPGTPHAAVMRELGVKFKARSDAGAGAGAGAGMGTKVGLGAAVGLPTVPEDGPGLDDPASPLVDSPSVLENAFTTFVL